MNRKLSKLGLALIVALVVAPSTAEAGDFTASSYPTTVTATSAAGNETIALEGGTVECAGHFKGTLSLKFFSLNVQPTYTKCKAFGFLSATVETANCEYVFTNPSGGFDNYSATTDIACGEFSRITITASTCKATIGSQTTIPTLDIVNDTAASDLLMQLTAGGLGFSYTVVTDGFACPFNGTGIKNGGQLTQDSAVTFDSTNGAKIDVG
jgi:hypothetical protein